LLELSQLLGSQLPKSQLAWYAKTANDNDNDKRLGLTAKADQPDHKKIQYTKNKIGQ